MRTKGVKVVLVLLVLMFCIGCMTFYAAAAGESAVVTLSEAAASQGEEVVVELNLTENPGLVGLLVEVGYDSSKLTLVSVENTGVLPIKFTNPNLEKNPVSLSWCDAVLPSNQTETGTIAKLTFLVLADCPDGEIPITLSYDPDNVFNVDFDNVPLLLNDGSITVHKHDYEATWSHTEDRTTAIVTLVCKVCGKEVTIETPLHSKVEVEPTYRKPGSIQYSAFIAYEDIGYGMGFCDTIPAIKDRSYDFAGAKIVVGNAIGRPGETVQIPISLENNPGLVCIRLQVAYDAEKLCLLNVNDTGNLPLQFVGPNLERNPVLILWCDAAKPDQSANGEIVYLTFAILDEIADGETAIEVDYLEDDLYNANGDSVLFEVVDGSVRITSVLPGDVNEDGAVNARDIAFLQRYVAGWALSINVRAADVNADGEIDSRDIALLQRSVAGWGTILK